MPHFRISTFFIFMAAVILLAAMDPKQCFASRHAIPIQGSMTSLDGENVTGVHTLVFSLYPDCSSSEIIFSTTKNIEFEENGIFQTNISLDSLTDEQRNQMNLSEDLCLEFSIDGDVLSPRLEFSTTPYARVAEYSDVAEVANTARALEPGFFGSILGSGLSFSNGSIEIDTGSAFSWTGTNSYTGQVVLSQAPNTTSSNNATLLINANSSVSNSSYLTVQDNGTDRFKVTKEGNVVIGGNLQVSGSFTLPDGSVDSTQLHDNAVTTSKISDGAVTTPKVADNAITTPKLADDVVTSAKISDGSIANPDISSSAAIDLSKLASASHSDLFDLSAATDQGKGLKLPQGAADPTNPASGEGLLFWDATANLLKVYDGAAWTTIGSGSLGGSIDSAEITDGSIVNSDINAAASIAYSKLNLSGSIVAGDLTNNAVTSAKILDGEIVNNDINASAGISFSKLASLSSGSVLIGNGSNVATATSLTGDITVNSSGVTSIGTGKITTGMIQDGDIVNADISSSAAIAYSKLNLAGSIGTGDLTNNAVTSAKINDGEIVNADIGTAAGIAYSKLNLSGSITSSDITDGTIVGGDLSGSIGITSTGAQDYSGASSFRIPVGSGVSSPTVNAAGQIAIDTDDDQLVIGVALNTKRVIPYRQTKCMTIKSATADDDLIPMFIFNQNATLISTSCYTTSSTATPTYTLEDASGDTVTTSATCTKNASTTWDSTTANNSFVKGDPLRFSIGTAPDGGSWMTICVAYAEDAQ